MASFRPLLVASLLIGRIAFGADAAPVLSGGIGEDERNEMLMQRADYNLRLAFAAKGSGSFLSDVRVVVTDAAKNEVARATSDGPWCWLRLPAGRYIVTATWDGKSLSRAAQVPARGGTELGFSWDDPGSLWERGWEPEHTPPRRPARPR